MMSKIKNIEFNLEDFVPATHPESIRHKYWIEQWESNRNRVLETLGYLQKKLTLDNQLTQADENNSETLAWHYVHGVNFCDVISKGRLLPEFTGESRDCNDFYYTFFSKNPKWDLTASPWDMHFDCRRYRMGWRATFNQECGLFRFGYPENKLLAWRELVEKSHMPGSELSPYSHTRFRQESRPKEWMGSVKAIEIKDLTIEAMLKGKWVRLKNIKNAANTCNAEFEIKKAA